MSPVFLLLLIGGGAALVASRKKEAESATGKPALKRIATSCATKNEALWFELGPLRFKLPKNMSVSAVDHRQRELSRAEKSTVKECGSPRTAPWVVELMWYESGDFSLTRDLMKTVADFAQSVPDTHFLCSVHFSTSPLKSAEIFALVNGLTPDVRGPEPGVLRESAGLFVDIGIEDPRDDVFTDIQGVVGVVHRKQKLYQPKGNSVVWFADDTRDGFPPNTCMRHMQALVGEDFLPLGSVAAMEAPSLAAVLAMPGNTAWGYVDWLLYNDPRLEPKLDRNDVESASSYIALKILNESGVPCDVYSFDWVTIDGVKVFYDWLVKVIKPWVSDHLGGVPFEG